MNGVEVGIIFLMPGTGTGGLSFAEIPPIVKISDVGDTGVSFCGTHGLSCELSDEDVCAKIDELEKVKQNTRIVIAKLYIMDSFNSIVDH